MENSTPRFQVFRNRCVWTLVALLFSATPLHAAVELEKQGDDIVVTIDGKPLGIYTVAKKLHRPYFREIRAFDGTLLTRPIAPPGGDHPHLRGRRPAPLVR